MIQRILFWVHLGAGLIAGLAIGIMCVTGVVLAFEKQLVAWAERDARRIEGDAPMQQRLTLDELQARLRAVQPEARPNAIVLTNEPTAAVAFSSGRAGAYYANPYTGEVREPTSKTMSEIMRVAIEWHRYLGFGGEVSRPRGKWVNGICNVAFFVLAATGLYLWMPRQWSWRALRPVVWFRQNATSKARDFNWHNTIGFWTAPVLMILTLTAMPISFRWAGNLIFTLTGTPQPAAGSQTGAPAAEIAAPGPEARRLPLEALLVTAQKAVPSWQTITLRLGGPQGSRARQSQQAGAPEAEAGQRAGGRSRGAQAVTFTIRERDSWPRTATTTLALNPFTGEIVQRTGYADLNAAQQVRAWTRFLHTGEAVGWVGQLLAGLASLGGAFLVYTGFALSWRRFFNRKDRVESDEISRSVKEPAAH